MRRLTAMMMAAVMCVMLESFGVAPVSQRYGGDEVYVCYGQGVSLQECSIN